MVTAIGTITQNAIECNGVNVDIIPSEFNMESLVTEISNYYSKN